MIKVIDAFPELIEALTESLECDGEQGLLGQVQNAVATKVTFDNSADAAYFYIEPARDLNVVEANVIGSKVAKTIEISTTFWTVLDIDNFDRLVGIEVLSPGSLKKELRKHASI